MEILNKIRSSINPLTQADFYKYLVLFLLSIVFLIALATMYFYRSAAYIEEEMDLVNIQRKKMRSIFQEKALVEHNKRNTLMLIEANENFKLSGAFTAILQQLHLEKKKITGDTTHIDIDAHYRETIFKTKLTEITIQETYSLLQELYKNDRISIEELEIAKSKRNQGAVDVTLTLRSPSKR